MISEINPFKFAKISSELHQLERQNAEKAMQNRQTKNAQDEVMKKLHAELNDIGRRHADLNDKESTLKAQQAKIQRKEKAILSFMTHEENKQARSATISALEAKKNEGTITSEEKLKLDEFKLHAVFESRASNYEAVIKN